MRKLTEQEKKFLSEVVDDHIENQLVEEEVYKNSPRRRFRPSRINPLFRPGFWITIILSIPVIITIAILYIQTRVELVVNSGLLKMLSVATLDKQKEFADGVGMDWLPAFISIYNNKSIIIAVSFTIAILIIIGILLLEYLVLKPRREEDEDYYE